MSFEPVGWTVVVVGRWNKAILSPKGIAQHIFKLPDGSPIQVSVPVDGVSAYFVRNPAETLSVHVETERLQIDLLKCTYAILEQAMKAGEEAMKELPVTPITAVGFNLNFKSNTVPEELLRSIECSIDSKIVANELELIGRSLGRKLKFNNGAINLSLHSVGEEYHVNCNFHLDTTKGGQAKEWLETPQASIKGIMAKIATILGIEFSEGQND